MRGIIICTLLIISLCGVFADKVVVGDLDTLTATTIYKYLKEADRPVFIQFYAGNCNFCKALAPLWAQLSRERSEERIAVVDCITEELLCDAWEISAVPAIFLYRDGNLYPYDGNRELEDLHDFLDVNSKNIAPIELPDELVLRKAIFREGMKKHGQGVTITFVIFAILFVVGLIVCLGCFCTPSIDNETITNEDKGKKQPAAEAKKPAEEPKKQEGKQGGKPKQPAAEAKKPAEPPKNKKPEQPNKKPAEPPKKQEGKQGGKPKQPAAEAKKPAEPPKKQENKKAEQNKKPVAEVIPKKEEKPVNSSETRKRKNAKK